MTLPDRPTLLLVDDDASFCRVLVRALEARGYAVDKAHDGASALRLIEEGAPEYAIIDLHLPDMSGLKVIEQLKAGDEQTNVLLLTGYASIATAIEAIKLGATHYLTKPCNADQILAAFQQHKPNPDVGVAPKPLSVDRLEWEHVQTVLVSHGGSISATARALNMHRRTLQRKLAKYPPRQ